MKDVKQLIVACWAVWFLSPVAIYEILQETKTSKKTKDATTKLNVYKQFYK